MRFFDLFPKNKKKDTETSAGFRVSLLFFYVCEA